MIYTYVHTYVCITMLVYMWCTYTYVYTYMRTHAFTQEPLECLFKPEVILKVYKQYVEWHDLTNNNNLG